MRVPKTFTDLILQPCGRQNGLAWFVVGVNAVHKQNMWRKNAIYKRLCETRIWDVNQQGAMLNWRFAFHNKLCFKCVI